MHRIYGPVPVSTRRAGALNRLAMLAEPIWQDRLHERHAVRAS